MKKIYSFLFGALLAVPVFAQEEVDVTNLIANPGFDEDLTFQADGSIKEVTEKESFSSRSHKMITEDGTIYAGSKTSAEGNGNWKRTDTEYSFNGFLGQIKGWTLTTPAGAGEWTYFGAVPYGLGAGVIGIADDNNDSWLTMPAKPEEADTEDNSASLYLRAGWGNYAEYTQVVNLPCAQYRLEYWINNLNFANTDASGLENRCEIICRKDVFEDTEGINADGWQKHVIEFTPTAEFTIKMGFKAGNYGSGKNPILLIDGLKLYKVGDADPEMLLQEDMQTYMDSLSVLNDENFADYPGISNELAEKIGYFEDIAYSGEIDNMEAGFKELKAYIETVNENIAKVEALKSAIDAATELLEAENPYPGIADLKTAIVAAEGALGDKGTFAAVEEQTEALSKAVENYYKSQVASKDNPADYTFLIDNPTFAAQGKWYTGEAGGDQRLNTVGTKTVWNAWRNTANFKEAALYQDLTDLPNGYYTVSAEMLTQTDCINDQHLLAKSSTSDVVSPVMTITGWDHSIGNGESDDSYTFETLETAQILVVDGKLTIGAIGTGTDVLVSATNDYRQGWWLATNFKLTYYGEATAEEYAAAKAAKIAAANEFASAMHYAADKETAIAAIKEAGEDLDAVNAALKDAEASEADYEAVTNGTLKTMQDGIAEGYSAKVAKVAGVPVKETVNYINSAEATSAKTADYTSVLRYYVDKVIPALEAAEATEIADATGKEALSCAINLFVAQLGSYETDTKVIDSYIAELNNNIHIAEAADIAYGDNTDVTAYITNPNIDGVSDVKAQVPGWTSTLSDSGNGNITNKSQQYDGNGNGYYLDSWNGTAGMVKVKNSQVINVPNGTYELTAYMRTTGKGFYLYAIADEGTPAMTEAAAIEIDNIKYINSAAETPTTVYTDSYGSIWKDAADKYMELKSVAGAMEEVSVYDIISDMTAGEPIEGYEAEWAILSANGGKGRGWFPVTVSVEVKNHKLEIGVATGDAFEGANAFEGTWFSADNFTLKMITAGDNTGWNPASDITAVESIKTNASASAAAVYSVSGARLNAAQKGINIVKMTDGSVKKVLVK